MSASNNSIQFPGSRLNSQVAIDQAIEGYEKKHGKLENGKIIRLSRRTFTELKASIFVCRDSADKLSCFEVIHRKAKQDPKAKHPGLLGQGAVKLVKGLKGEGLERRALATLMPGCGSVREGSLLASKLYGDNDLFEAGRYLEWTSAKTSEKKAAFLMGLCDGDLGKFRGLETKAFGSIAMQMAKSMSVIHGDNLAYLDAKPGNYLFRGDIKSPESIEVLAADFDTLIENGPVEVDCLIGSPGYLAPEGELGQIVDNPQMLDIYSLGISFHSLLSDEAMPSFKKLLLMGVKTPNFKVAKSLEAKAQKDESLKRSLELIKRTTQHKPEMRPTISKVLEELEDIFQPADKSFSVKGGLAAKKPFCKQRKLSALLGVRSCAIDTKKKFIPLKVRNQQKPKKDISRARLRGSWGI